MLKPNCGVGRSLLRCVLLAMVLGAPSAAVAATPVGHHALKLQPHFRYFGSAGFVWHNEQYVFASPFYGAEPGQVGVLIDSRGHGQVLSRSGCRAPHPGLPGFSSQRIVSQWLLFDCSTSDTTAVQLYSLTRGSWQAVALNPTLAHPCGNLRYCGTTIEPVAVGARWLAFSDQQCINGTPSCQKYSNGTVFQNMQSGVVQQRAPTTTSRTVIDLNAAELTRRVCSPVNVPAGGTVWFFGSFGLAVSSDLSGNQTLDLQRCGHRLHQLLVGGTPLVWDATSHLILWQTYAANELDGVFLPSRQRLVIPLPAQIHLNITELAITPHTLYLLDSQNQLWATPTPHPPSNRKKHH